MITFPMKEKNTFWEQGSTAAISIRVMAFPSMSHLFVLSALKHLSIGIEK
jgi:hypothetical protein